MSFDGRPATAPRGIAGFLPLFLVSCWIGSPPPARAAEPPAAGDSWAVPVPGFVPPQPGEHPRLFFRKSDLPALKQRAQTPAGKAILARLRETLGGGEAMPASFGPSTRPAGDAPVAAELPEGAYTLFHGAGFGFLYQLAGDARYADLGRQCVEKALAGQGDRDARYSFTAPAGQLRAGPALAAVAMAYDLCYDGWDDAFRRKVALALQTYKVSDDVSLERLALDPRHHPASRHWGPEVGGAEIAVLALLGDPGTDADLLRTYDAALRHNVAAALTDGFGDGGYFPEHAGPSLEAANAALVPCLQALKVAAGKDYLSPRPNGPWLTLRWAQEIVPARGRPAYPCRHPSPWGGEDFLGKDNAGSLAGGGAFSQGFGAVADDDKPALLWVYEHFVAGAHGPKFDAVNYPHRAVLAFVNWPPGPAVSPAARLPRVHADPAFGYYAFRDGWKDADDVLVTALLHAQGHKAYKYYGPEDMIVWGLGLRAAGPLHVVTQLRTTSFRAGRDGSGVVAGEPFTGGEVSSFAVDVSGASGARLLVAATGPAARAGKDVRGDNGAATKTTAVEAGGRTFLILTLHRGDAPEPKADGDRVIVGAQSIRFDGKTIVLEKFDPAPQ